LDIAKTNDLHRLAGIQFVHKWGSELLFLLSIASTVVLLKF